MLRLHRRRKRLLRKLTLLCVAGASEARTPAVQEGVRSGLSFSANRDGSGWLPIETPTRDRIFLPATVNGHRVQAFLDSGSPVMAVDAAFARELGLRGGRASTADGIGGSARSRQVIGLRMKLGSLEIAPREAYALDYSGIAERLRHPLPVVIGGEAFGRTVVDIDFPNNRLAFRRPGSYHAPQGATRLRLFKQGDNWAVRALVDGKPARMLFDLGNGSPILLYPAWWNNADFKKGRRLSTAYSGGLGGPQTDFTTTIDSLTVGTTVLSNIPAILLRKLNGGGQDTALSGNLGMPVWNRSHIVVDFPQRQLFIIPPVDAKRVFAFNSIGVTLQPVRAGEKVTSVATGSPAQDAGLLVGQVITEVREAATGKLVPLHDDWNRSPVGRSLILTMDGGRQISLKAQKYF